MFSSNASQVSNDANFVEDVFSTYLYTGNSSTQTITNGIDLAGEGGLVWVKSRNTANSFDHRLFDTVRGNDKSLISNNTAASATGDAGLWVPTSSGFSTINGPINYSTDNYVSWTFRKQPKFFDVVTWTGDGTDNRAIPHNLGSVPGCIIVKGTSIAENWTVYHRSQGATKFGLLDQTDAFGTSSDRWNDTEPTSTVFTVGNAAKVNASGQTYVAYLFAHNAGGFGLSGTDNVISCGSYTSDGSGNVADVNLGYEPQWLLTKKTNSTDNWVVVDNMRGLPATSASAVLRPNTSDAEFAGGTYNISATGFNPTGTAGLNNTYIYIAIRRGPMKVPTDGTKVYGAVSRTGTDANATISSLSFPPDTLITKNRSGTASPIGAGWLDRLRGLNNFLTPSATSAEDTAQTDILRSWNMNGATLGPDANTSRFNWSGNTYINWFFRRAPGFFDEVCYTGNNAFDRAIPHNLAAVPELVITKVRSTTANWAVYAAATGLGYPMALNTTAAAGANPYVWGTTAPTSTNFYIGDDTRTNGGGFTYVSYLFATCAGVSKVGSYTGTATTLQINCGFTAGARFVMIKRTDSTGDWYVWDSARGIVAGDDPYLLLNSTAAEVTGTDYVDTYSAGFELTSTAPAAINASGGSYIFLAIA